MNPLIIAFDNKSSSNNVDDKSIYIRLLDDISKGCFVSGDRLVTTKLAKRYNSSINPVREALKQLEGEGFVTFQKNSGARVATFEYESMRDVFEILQLLEPYFLECFATKISQSDIRKLKQIVQLMKETPLADYVRFRELDTAFHWQMYQGHYNQQAVALWRSKKLVLQAFHANLPISSNRFKQAIKEHQQLLAFLEEGDGKSAKLMLENHIKLGGQYWANKLNQSAELAVVAKAQVS